MSQLFFFFNDTATTEIYTLSLHDALPISADHGASPQSRRAARLCSPRATLGGTLAPFQHSARAASARGDRKSTRLNSSHSQISYAVFCLKKKKNIDSSSRAYKREPSCSHP